MKTKLLFLVSVLFLSGFTSQKPAPVTDFLQVKGPLTFQKTDHALAWSSHPTASYYKQEYLPAGQTVEKFTQMLLLEALVGDLSVMDVAKAQVRMLEERKKTDAVAQYQVIENPENGEIILDFTMSAGTAKAVSVVEWSAYRYKAFTDKNGTKGVMLFGVSKRGYDAAIPDFFKILQAERADIINALGAYDVPSITVSK